MWNITSYVILLLLNGSLGYFLDGPKNNYEDFTEPTIDVKVVAFNKKLAGITKVKYGQHLKLICDIQLSASMAIRWFGRHRALNGELGADNKEMDVIANIQLHGEYITCEAYLLSNPKIKKTFGTNFAISDLAPPKISDPTANKITVRENDKLTISCKIIEGIPQPTVKWQMKKFGDNRYRDLHVIDEEVVIDKATFCNVGKYKCTAVNAKGQATKSTEVVVEKVPVTAIEEGSAKTFPYGNTTVFTCRVQGYPLPTTVWRSNNRNKVYSEEIIISWHEKISRIILQNMKKSNKYTCFAHNTLGKAKTGVNVTILSPFVVHRHPENTTNGHYEAKTLIVCDIRSSFPMTIKWFHRSSSSSVSTEIHTDSTYNVDSNDTVLTIMAPNLTAVGNYTCEAALVSDKDEKISFTTDLEIDNLTPPKISDLTANKITVRENDRLKLSCKIIEGIPPPTVNWQMKKFGDNEYRDLHVTDEEVVVDNATFANFGQYRCTAVNARGQATKSTEVVVKKTPVAAIEEGSAKTLPYGNTTVFSCRVQGYPLPTTVWRSNDGNKVYSEEIIISWHEKISRIKLQFMKKSNNYTCFAQNTLGKAETGVNVTILSPFVVHRHPENITNVHYEAKTSIVCDIRSSFPMTIKWFHRSSSSSVSTEIHTDSTYNVDSNDTVLTIMAPNLTAVGNYTCEAALVSDKDEKISFTTDLQIDNLAPPKISDLTANKITVRENDKLTLSCKIIQGIPPPTVNWQMKKFGDNEYRDLHVTDEELVVDSATFANVGQYKCTAVNAKGQATKSIEVVVEKNPDAAIEEGSAKTFPYGNTTVFTCRVQGYPLPTTVWRSNNRNKVYSEEVIMSWHEKISRIKLQNMKKSNNYTCFAQNTLGKSETGVNVTILSPFVVHRHPENTTNVHYEAKTSIVCDIRSSFPMTIKWFHRSSSSSVSTEIHTDSTYNVDSNDTVLTIMAPNLTAVGNYTCEAALVSDKDEKISFTTDLQIDNLTPPKISDLAANKITVRENDKLTLFCKVIEGIPQPTVKWQFMKFGENNYRDLHVTDEEVVVDNATFANVGQYRCTAVNAIGQATKSTEVVVEKTPVAAIEEGSAKTFPYGNTTVFSCRVQGYPLPTTVWRSNDGNKVYSEDIISWHEMISHIKLQNMKKSNNYTCFAQNTLGKAETGVNVTILSPFVVHQHPENKTNVHYEAKTSIVCDIRSSFPMTIKWFHRSSSSSVSTEIHTGSTYNVDSNDTVLTIMAPNLTAVGNYTCEAALVSDKDEKISFTTDLQINDLAPPSFNSTIHVVLMENSSLSVSCNISGGVPPPSRNWQVMRHGDSTYKDLHLTNQELHLEDVTISDAGYYRCEVSNAIGKSFQSTELLVRKAPVTITESAVTVMFGSDYTFTCRVIGYPLPSITWNDKNGVLIPSQVSTVNEHELISRITIEKIKAMNRFSCSANNPLGKNESSIDVTVLAPFVVHQKPDSITNVHYLASENLVCNITSSLPMTIKWFHNSTEIHTSDKFTISTNKTVLTINSMGLEMPGRYRCEASLLSDENEKKEFSSDVLIDDLQPPVITSHAGNSVTVKNFEELSLACKATGHPTPVMTWTAQTTGSPSFNLIGTGDSICSTNLGYVQAGTYKCTATNIVGEDSRTTSVTVV